MLAEADRNLEHFLQDGNEGVQVTQVDCKGMSCRMVEMLIAIAVPEHDGASGVVGLQMVVTLPEEGVCLQEERRRSAHLVICQRQNN